MALHNIIGLLFPLGVALTIGALAIGLFYRDRTRDLRHDNPDDTEGFTSDFHPGPGFDTRQAPSNSSDEEEKCCICIDGMKRYQTLKTLPCAHRFHKKCVDSWLRYEQFCPTCRTVVVE